MLKNMLITQFGKEITFRYICGLQKTTPNQQAIDTLRSTTPRRFGQATTSAFRTATLMR
jgi:hypothetical protein